MGRNRVGSDEKKLKGNAGKRDLPEELEVGVPSLRAPRGLNSAEKKYWRIWAPALIKVGKLTVLTQPSLLTLIKMKVRLDQVNRELRKKDGSLLQETVFTDKAGNKHCSSKESAYSRLSRDLTVTVHRLEKTWGLTADSMAGLFKAKRGDSDEEKFLQ